VSDVGTAGAILQATVSANDRATVEANARATVAETDGATVAETDGAIVVAKAQVTADPWSLTATGTCLTFLPVPPARAAAPANMHQSLDFAKAVSEEAHQQIWFENHQLQLDFLRHVCSHCVEEKLLF